MNAYLHYTPMSDTVEISTSRKGWPVTDQPTEELLLPLRPVVTRYETPRRRFFRSRFVADLRRGWTRTTTVIGVFTAAAMFFVIVRGIWVLALLAGLAR